MIFLKVQNKWSFKVIIGLLIIILLFLPFSFFGQGQSSVDVSKVAKYDFGKTIFPGEDVINDFNINKYPLASNLNYLLDKLLTLDIYGIISAISTGVVPLPISEFSAGGISKTGIAEGFSGPGILVEENNKLLVKAPDNFLWGYKVPYTLAVKVENGVNIVEDNKIIKHVAKEDINNDTIPNLYLSGDFVAKWFKKAKVNDSVTLNYGIGNFSDNRSLIKPDEIKSFFGEEVFNYTYKYPSGSPIMVYMVNYNEEIATTSYSYLGSHPQYNDAKRAFNAQQFVRAWNNTIIPPNSTSSGTEIIGFAMVSDPEAPGGYASHGVCPPARALRSSSYAMGFSLPKGMNGDVYAVNFGVNPGSGIKVTNSGDYPVKIVMWTVGKGPNMVIYARMVKFKPSEY